MAAHLGNQTNSLKQQQLKSRLFHSIATWLKQGMSTQNYFVMLSRTMVVPVIHLENSQSLCMHIRNLFSCCVPLLQQTSRKYL